MTVAETPDAGRAKPVLERFEVSEAGLSAHLTEEQKAWKVVKLRPRSERFEVLAAPPTLVLKLYLAGAPGGADPVALAADILSLVQAVSEVERELGGGGLTLSDQHAGAEAVALTLRHAVAEGAGRRATELTTLLSSAKVEPAEVTQSLASATRPAAERMRLLIAGSRTVARCEISTPAA